MGNCTFPGVDGIRAAAWAQIIAAVSHHNVASHCMQNALLTSQKNRAYDIGISIAKVTRETTAALTALLRPIIALNISNRTEMETSSHAHSDAYPTHIRR